MGDAEAGLDGIVVGRQFSVGTVGGKAVGADIDDVRLDLADRLVAQPQALDGLRPERMDESIGAFDHFQESRARRRVLEVEAERALVAIHIEIGRAHAGRLARLADMAHRVALRRLDLDDVGALVGQQHGAVGPEDDVGEVDDPDAFERAGHCPVLCWERPRDCHRLDLASRRRKLRRKTGRKSWTCAPRCAAPRTAMRVKRRSRPATGEPQDRVGVLEDNTLANA